MVGNENNDLIFHLHLGYATLVAIKGTTMLVFYL